LNICEKFRSKAVFVKPDFDAGCGYCGFKTSITVSWQPEIRQLATHKRDCLANAKLGFHYSKTAPKYWWQYISAWLARYEPVRLHTKVVQKIL
jgi:hypothetical protein